MKIFQLILIVLALALAVYNATLINYDAPLQGDSTIALIGVVASLCAIVLLLILNISKKIQDKIKGK